MLISLFFYNAGGGLAGDSLRRLDSAELFSFTTESRITVRQASDMDHIYDMFQLPMAEIAFQQYLQLNTELENISITDENDIWSYIWGHAFFSVNKALSGH
jgi:hypothetical protein